VADPPQDDVPGRPAHQGLVKTIRPSKEAAEFVALLGYHYDWPTLQLAFKRPQDYTRPDEIGRHVRSVLKDKKLFGAKREAKYLELRRAMIIEKTREREATRKKAWNLHELVSEYARFHRVRILAIPEKDRQAAAKEIIAAFCNQDGTVLQRLRGLNEQQIAKRKAEVKNEKIARELREAGLKGAYTKPMIEMQFPASAANALRTIEEYKKEIEELLT